MPSHVNTVTNPKGMQSKVYFDHWRPLLLECVIQVFSKHPDSLNLTYLIRNAMGLLNMRGDF